MEKAGCTSPRTTYCIACIPQRGRERKRERQTDRAIERETERERGEKVPAPGRSIA